MLKYILLGFLNYQPLSGYDLKRMMDESTVHFWHAYHSQIYTTLRKLEEDGLLESEAEGDDAEAKLQRRVYHITGAGRRDLRDWLAQPMIERSPVKEELLPRIFFSGQRDKHAVLDELRVQRRLHQEKLDYYNALKPQHLMYLADGDQQPDVSRDVPYWTATLNFGKQYEAMYIAWLDATIAQLEDI